MMVEQSSAIALEDLDEQSWLELSDSVEQLEEAWQSGSVADLMPFVPDTPDPLRLRILVELVKADQELRSANGESKSLESYLGEWPELKCRNELQAELLESECLTKLASGTAVPTPDELASRFPDLAGQINFDRIQQHAQNDSWVGERKLAPEAEDTSIPGLESTNDGTPKPSGKQVSTTLSEGQRFGRYRIAELLGAGGMGSVYRAFDTELERDVALKIPKLDVLGNEKAVSRFVREGQAAARIEHPNICTIYDAGKIDGVPFISMSLIQGPSLCEWKSAKQPDRRKIAEALLKVANALAVIHDAKIVHRDIKPSNVMVNEAGEPLLMDFGLARTDASDYELMASESTVIGDAGNAIDFNQAPQGGPLTGSGALLGTVPYMSPEQIHGHQADSQTDIYSYGVLFYQLLTGQLPHASPKILDLIRQIGNDEPTKPRDLDNSISPQLESICLKAMATNRAERYQSAEELVHDLDGYLGNLRASSNRHGRIRSIALTAAVLVAGIVTFVFTGTGEITIVAGENTTFDGRKLKPGKHVISAGVGSHVIVITRQDGKKHEIKIRIKRRGAAVAVPTHSIDGTVWNDRNGDGLRQRSEEPLADQLVFLDLDGDGVADEEEPQRKSGKLGEFRFEGLMPDTYIVRAPDAEVYSTSFQSDPYWQTPHAERYRWDMQAGEFVLIQRNVNHADDEHVYHDVGLALGSFRLEFDASVSSLSYASGVQFGLFDSDLNAEDEGSLFAFVSPRRIKASLPTCGVSTLKARQSRPSHGSRLRIHRQPRGYRLA